MVLDVRRAGDGQWDRLVGSSLHVTFFHTREWAQLWERYTGEGTAVAHVARFDDGVEALLPAVERAPGGRPAAGRLAPALRSLVSAHGATYGGWISPYPLTAAHHEALLRHTAGWNLSITQNPHDPGLAAAQVAWTRDDVTHAVDLRRPWDDVRRSWSRGHRSAVAKAGRAGLTVVAASTPAQWRAYREIHRLTVARWERPQHVVDDRFLDLLANSRSGDVRLWVAEHEGSVVAGAICLTAGRTVSYWHGAFDPRVQHLRAAPFLHAEIMRRAREEGHHWYDFCPSGGNEGVMAFKDRFGAERLPVHTLETSGRLKRGLRSLRG